MAVFSPLPKPHAVAKATTRSIRPRTRDVVSNSFVQIRDKHSRALSVSTSLMRVSAMGVQSVVVVERHWARCLGLRQEASWAPMNCSAASLNVGSEPFCWCARGSPPSRTIALAASARALASANVTKGKGVQAYLAPLLVGLPHERPVARAAWGDDQIEATTIGVAPLLGEGAHLCSRQPMKLSPFQPHRRPNLASGTGYSATTLN